MGKEGLSSTEKYVTEKKRREKEKMQHIAKSFHEELNSHLRRTPGL